MKRFKKILSGLLLFLGISMIADCLVRWTYEAQVMALADEIADHVRKYDPDEPYVRHLVSERNRFKLIYRNFVNPITNHFSEQRNKKKYGNILGPTYEMLADYHRKKGVPESEINLKIATGAGKSNRKVNLTADWFMICGSIILGIYSLVAAWQIWRSDHRIHLIFHMLLFVLSSILIGYGSSWVAASILGLF